MRHVSVIFLRSSLPQNPAVYPFWTCYDHVWCVLSCDEQQIPIPLVLLLTVQSFFKAVAPCRTRSMQNSFPNSLSRNRRQQV